MISRPIEFQYPPPPQKKTPQKKEYQKIVSYWIVLVYIKKKQYTLYKHGECIFFFKQIKKLQLRL